MNAQFSAQCSDSDPLLEDLLRLMRQRLLLMHDVARAKWNAKKPLADTDREKIMLRGLVEKGRGMGIEPEFAGDFFTAQIDASRLLQMNDLRRWKADGQGPFADVPDLNADLRPRIDTLNDKLMASLAKVRPALRGRDALVRRLAAKSLGGPGITAEIRDKAIRPLMGSTSNSDTQHRN
jgi:chorismate mutase